MPNANSRKKPMRRTEPGLCGLSRLLALFAFFLTIPVGSMVSAQQAADEHLDDIDIFLHTVDVGNLVYNNFGHTAIRVRDRFNRTDRVYNWGIFDFDNPIPFALNFYKGNLYYRLGDYPFSAAMRSYNYEHRTVWEDRIFLTNEQKKIFLDRLKWNMRPENRSYSYQYFFDNCSTRPRDYLDEALGGVLSAHAKDELTSKTFREQVMEGYAFNPGMDVLLDLGMNSNIDRYMTRWESMFHPLHLRDGLIDYSRSKHFLIGESRILVDFQRPGTYPGLGHAILLIVGGIPLALIGIALYAQQKKGAFSKRLLRFFAFWSLPWTMAGALFGFLMCLNWIASGHMDLHHNANMLLFWPTDLILLLVVGWIFIKGRQFALRPQAYRFMQVYLVGHLLGSLLLPVLRMFGFIHQNVDRVSVFLLPPYLIMILLLFRVGIRRQEA